jgi:hypothetical protein
MLFIIIQRECDMTDFLNVTDNGGFEATEGYESTTNLHYQIACTGRHQNADTLKS